MNEITTVGLDLAKSVFQLHGIDRRGVVVLRRQCRRGQLLNLLVQLPPCKVAMEACASAHYWGRQISALGHRVMLIAPQYVKPFVRGDKSDRHDAQGICEAALRPDMPQVALKSEEQQALLSLHRMRELLEKQRKQLANQLRGLLAEFGQVLPVGVAKFRAGLAEAIEGVPQLLQPALCEGARRLSDLERLAAEHTEQI
jgi:transposase